MIFGRRCYQILSSSKNELTSLMLCILTCSITPICAVFCGIFLRHLLQYVFPVAFSARNGKMSGIIVFFFLCLSEFQINLNFNHKIRNKRRNSNIVVSSNLRAQLNFVCALPLTLLFILSERSNHYKRCCDICRRSAACNIHKERKRNTLNDVAVQHITGWTAIWMRLLWSSVYLCLCLCWYVRILCLMTDARLWRMM